MFGRKFSYGVFKEIHWHDKNLTWDCCKGDSEEGTELRHVEGRTKTDRLSVGCEIEGEFEDNYRRKCSLGRQKWGQFYTS